MKTDAALRTGRISQDSEERGMRPVDAATRWSLGPWFITVLGLWFCIDLLPVLPPWKEIEQKEKIAAWVQAGGAILALAVSIGTGWFAARAARVQQRAEWAQRRLESALVTLARMQACQQMARLSLAGVDEAIKFANPVQPRVLEILARCVGLLEHEIQVASSADAVDGCWRLLAGVVELRDTATPWAEQGVVRGGSRYELHRKQLSRLFDETIQRFDAGAAALRIDAGLH